MDEQKWQTCDDLRLMFDHLRAQNVNRRKTGRRKLKLFACACARAVWAHLNEPCRAFVEAAELFADERISQDELKERYLDFTSAYDDDGMRLDPLSGYGITWALLGSRLLDTLALGASSQVGMVAEAKVRAERAAGDSEEQIGAAVRRAVEQTRREAGDLAREVFGNPFRPPPKRKFPAELRGLAQACYDDHSHYPVLADALADLGEDEAAAHCRLPWHVRGCHVVDWVRGKA
jgi:hypothetical protein